MKTLKRITLILAIIGLLTAVSLADSGAATYKELGTAAIMGLLSAMSILSLTYKDNKYGNSNKCN